MNINHIIYLQLKMINQIELLILSYHENNHFDIIYSIKEHLENNFLYNDINEINVNNKLKKKILN